MRLLFVALLMAATLSCAKADRVPTKRATLHRTGGTTLELVPQGEQLPFCLVYSVSRSGLTRQLTMSPTNESFECTSNRPIGGHTYKIPMSEGPVRLYVLFTSQRVNAASVSQQMLEAPQRQNLSILDFRLPGQATLESFDFSPEEDVEPALGILLDGTGLSSTADAGAAP
jgi:hypothetical protein